MHEKVPQKASGARTTCPVHHPSLVRWVVSVFVEVHTGRLTERVFPLRVQSALAVSSCCPLLASDGNGIYFLILMMVFVAIEQLHFSQQEPCVILIDLNRCDECSTG